MNDKKGQAFVWLTALMLIFSVGLIYIVMSRPFEVVLDTGRTLVNSTEYKNTFTQLNTFWKLWPVLVVVGLLMWAFLESMRRDPNETYL